MVEIAVFPLFVVIVLLREVIIHPKRSACRHVILANALDILVRAPVLEVVIVVHQQIDLIIVHNPVIHSEPIIGVVFVMAIVDAILGRDFKNLASSQIVLWL